MEVIVGKKKTGKTKYILEKMRNILDENDGLEKELRSNIYIIVPDQYTNMYERLISENLSDGTLTDVEIISFSRLAKIVMLDTRYRNVNFIDKISRKIIISDILENLDLKILKKDEDQISSISKSISDFKSFGITPKDAMLKIENGISEDSNKILNLKLEDLNLIYEKYQEFIKDKYIDEEDILEILFEILNTKEYFSNSYVFLAEFQTLDVSQKNVFKEIAKQAKDIFTVFLSKDISKKENESSEKSIFDEVEKTIFSILNIFDEIKEERKKSGKNYTVRYTYLEENFGYSDEIKVFEKVFSGEDKKELNEEEKNILNEKVEDIKYISFEKKEDELNYIAQDILKKINEEGYFLEDFLILSNNISEDGSEIEKVFEKFNIKVNNLEEINILNNIFIEYILSLLKAAYYKNSEDIFSLLKLNILDFKEEDILRLESYVVKWNISGYMWDSKWKAGSTDENFKKIIETKEKVLNFLNSFKNNIEEKRTGAEKIIEIYKHIDEIKLFENTIKKISKLKEKTIDSKHKIILENIKQNHYAIINILNEIIDKICYIYENTNVDTKDLINILEDSLNLSSLKNVPNNLNAVDIRDINLGKDNKKIIYVMSSSEDYMPKGNGNVDIITDSEKEIFKQNGIEFLNTEVESIYNFEYILYNAIFSASDKIIFTYTNKDILGNTKRRSIYFNKIKNIFTKFKENHQIEDVLNLDSLKYIKYIKDNKKEKKLIEEIAANKYSEYILGEDIEDFSKKIIKKLKEENIFAKEEEELKNKNSEDDLKKEILDEIYKDKIYTSISRIESFSKCPFYYNVKYNIRAKEKEVYELRPLDTGNFIHKVLEIFAKNIKNELLEFKNILPNIPYYEIEKEEKYKEDLKTYLEKVKEKIDQSIRNVSDLNEYEMFKTSSKFKNLSKKLSNILEKMCIAVAESLRLSNFEIYMTEKKIENKIFNNLERKLGKEIILKGIIDRIDILENNDQKYFRIIDYKSSKKDIKPAEIYSGINLQMPIYSYIIEEKENIKSAGLLYFAAESPKIKEKIETKEKYDEKVLENFKMSGILLEDEDILRSMDKSLMGNGDKSKFVPVSYTKKGELSALSKTLKDEDYETLIEDTKNIAENILKQMFDGKTDITPLEGACTFCPYKSICMVDRNKNNIRRYKNINKWKIKE